MALLTKLSKTESNNYFSPLTKRANLPIYINEEF